VNEDPHVDDDDVPSKEAHDHTLDYPGLLAYEREQSAVI
jgi:hypothetical protein